MQKNVDTIANSANGKPLVGAQVTVQNYPSGTTATVYQTNALTSPITQPITVAADGSFPFYAPDGRYQYTINPVGAALYVLTDILFEDPADGTNIDGATSKATPVDADETPLYDSATSFSLKKLTLANLKATLKTYFDTLYATIAGSAAQAFAARNLPIDVVTYGAVGDGVTDDTTAIQAAHTAAVAAGFKSVLFPTGTYKFTSLTWSPFVEAIAIGKVTLTTALAGGNAITINDSYGGLGNPGKPCTVFYGNFYLTNSNAGNTAYAIFMGGVTNANNAPFISINGMQVIGFNSGVLCFGYNVFLCKFYNFWAYQNAGSQICTATSITNSCENIFFIGCIFSGTSSTQAGPLIDINNINGMNFTFVGCSADYLTSLNKTGNTSHFLKITWLGGHLEANMTALPYLENDSNSTWDICGAYVTSPSVAGLAIPMISRTTNSGTTRFTKAAYVIGATATLFHELGAGAYGVYDYAPNIMPGSAAPTNFVVQNPTSVVGYDGITGEKTQWIGTLTGCTTSPTSTVYCQLQNNVVTLDLPAMSGTSNATTKTITGMPTRFKPARLQRFYGAVADNSGATVMALCTIETSGVLTYFATPGAGAWTASGVATISQNSISYLLT